MRGTLAGLVFLAGVAGAAQAAEIKGVVKPRMLKVPLAAPQLPFTNAGGETMTVRHFAGKVVVLTLWASWCSPCLAEMPSLDRLAGSTRDIAVVAVSLDADGPAAARRFLRDQALGNLAPYHDSQGRMLQMPGARGLPTSWVIDPKGRIVAVVEGAVAWTSPSMLGLLGGLRRGAAN